MTANIENNTAPPLPVWFWILSTLALLWFLMDVIAFAMRVFMLDSMPAEQQLLYAELPVWVNAVFALEVFGGLLGSIMLLLRSKLSVPFFTISIFGVVSQTFYVYFLSDAFNVMGMMAIIMPLLAIVIGTGMIALSKKAVSKKWIPKK